MFITSHMSLASLTLIKLGHFLVIKWLDATIPLMGV